MKYCSKYPNQNVFVLLLTTGIQCNQPNLKANSNITNPKTLYVYKDIVVIECASGYQTNMTGSVTCGRDGYWKGETPNCTGNGVCVYYARYSFLNR